MRSIVDNRYFVTGTDTDVGKTIASLGLVHSLKKRGYVVHTFKPVAAGSTQRACFAGDALNDDAFLLQQVSSCRRDYDQVNPFLLDLPIAPHIAAARCGMELTAEETSEYILRALGKSTSSSDIVVIEGAGGWRVPLGAHENFSDVAINLSAKVVMVVAIKLGCLNHALLTAEAILSDGLELAGWIANFPEQPDNEFDSEIAQANIETLEQRLSVPLLAQIPFIPSAGELFDSQRRESLLDQIAGYFDLERFI